MQKQLDLKLYTTRGQWITAFQPVFELLSQCSWWVGPEWKSSFTAGILLCVFTAGDLLYRSLFSATMVTLQDSIGSGTGVYKFPVVWKKQNSVKFIFLGAHHTHICFLSRKNTLWSLFPFIIISLNIAEGSGMMGHKMELCLQTHTMTQINSQHTMFSPPTFHI